jgi:hypothetical protein
MLVELPGPVVQGVNEQGGRGRRSYSEAANSAFEQPFPFDDVARGLLLFFKEAFVNEAL